MKRIFLASMQHESNSFNPIVTRENDFIKYFSDEIYDHLRKNDAMTGIINGLRNKNFELIPSVFVRAVPNGEVDSSFYLKMRKQILEVALKAHADKAIDAIVLSLHGSMRVIGIGEAEGDLLSSLKKELPQVPIFASLDTHTSMSAEMHRHLEAAVAYKCAPHTDCTETGEHLASIVVDYLNQEIKCYRSWVKIPFIIAGEQSSTESEPMKTLVSELKDKEKEEGVLALSYLMGYPWSDHDDITMGVYTVVSTSQKHADELALSLAQKIWDKRFAFDFTTPAYEVVTAWEKACQLAKDKSPVFLSDSGDNPTAGASSDQTELLKLVVESEQSKGLKIVYGGIYDPIATLKCKDNVGESISLTLGSAFDQRVSQAITLKGKVLKYVEKWDSKIFPSSDLALFRVNDVDIVIAEKHIGYIKPDVFQALGIEPQERDIVICKLGYLTEFFEPIAQHSILALSKGNTYEKLIDIPYENLTLPVFPKNHDLHYNPRLYLMKKR